MTFDQFPAEYENRIMNDSQPQRGLVETESQKRIKELLAQREAAHESKTLSSFWGIIVTIFGSVLGGVFFALIASMVVCSCVCIYNDDWRLEQTAFLISFAGCSVLAILTFLILSIKSDRTQKTKDDIQELINAEVAERDREIQAIKETVQRKADAYKVQFEEHAKQLSTKFTESDLATKVIDWMTTGFVKTISAADRRGHISEICVPFSFNVYTYQISCNFGTFDFETQRCRNLEGPLEQTALARAIASAIQLNIAMKFPQDSSGTDVVIDTDFQYNCHYDCPINGFYIKDRRADFVSARLTYFAQNGNYQAPQDW